MAELLPFDLTSVLSERLRESRKPTGELYCSTHLTGSLRHAMLDVAGAPKHERPLTDEITLHTGDMWHDWIYAQLDRTGWPYMREVRLNRWLPEGWRGRADLIIYHPEYEAFVLADIKTTKGESLFWINKAGAKESHIWQASAYFWALATMGLPMLQATAIYYWPKNAVRDQEIRPVLQEVHPLGIDVVKDEMEYRWERVRAYLTAFDESGGDFLNDELEPVQERNQKLTWNPKQKVFDLKLVPDWSAAFCDYPDEFCDCNTKGTTKIGHFTVSGEYSARSGYDEETPKISPTERQLAQREVK